MQTSPRVARRPSFALLSFAAAALVAFAAVAEPARGTLDRAATTVAVTRLTTEILERSQFAHRKLDDQLASQFLDRYLDSLDGGRFLFLQSDVAELAPYRAGLADATRRQGDTRLAHVVFRRYLERLGQRAAYVDATLKSEKLDFSGDEQFVFDREDAKRPADLAAAQALWKQQLRFEYLQEKLGSTNEKPKSHDDIAQALRRRSTRLAQTMGKLSEDAVLELYLNALAHVYDPHSDYLGREQLQSFQIGMSLSLAGIGAALVSDDGYCTIRELVPGSPAAKSGQLKAGDRLVGVSQGPGKEETDLIEMPLAQAVDLIRGPKGTPVILSVIPAGESEDADRRTVSLVRDEIKLEDQQAKASVVDVPTPSGARRIGVIELPSFYAAPGERGRGPVSVTADVEKLIGRLQQEKVTGVLLDMRRNGGGSLDEAIKLTGLFIPSGPVVQTRDREGRVEMGTDDDGKVLYDGPLVVLTSRLSASASEIVAGALQDYGRAVVVGDTATFGKGTVQTMIPLAEMLARQGLLVREDPGALKVTISKFYLPSGASTQLRGVKSDIVLPSLTDLPEIGEADLDNPLPWDTIAAAKLTRSAKPMSAVLAQLKQRSAQRVGRDPAFADLKAERDRFVAQGEKKSVSLNETVRRREKAEQEAREATRKAKPPVAMPPTYDVTLATLAAPLKPKAPEPKKPAGDDDDDDGGFDRANDLVLREAQLVLVDAVDALGGRRFTAR